MEVLEAVLAQGHNKNDLENNFHRKLSRYNAVILVVGHWFFPVASMWDFVCVMSYENGLQRTDA